jgi:hypothetical protein
MAGSAQHVVRRLEEFNRAFWLPPGGWDNGLDDRAWVALLDVRGEGIASLLLMSLREADVPAYAAVRWRPLRRRAGARQHQPVQVRIWVGARGYGTGRTVLMRTVPGLLEKYGPHVIV